jgi:protein SCO1/2
MIRDRPVRPFWRLLLPLLLLWPLAASGHGPGHEKTSSSQQAKQTEQPAREERSATVAPNSQEHIAPGKEPAAEKPLQQQEAVTPGEWIEEKTGEHIPLDAVFKNERGETVALRQLVDRPTLLLPIYYRCPTGCSFRTCQSGRGHAPKPPCA